MPQKMVPDVVRGHEIWIEHLLDHHTPQRLINCRLCFGHNMAMDGIADLPSTKAYVIDPDNNRTALDIVPGEKALKMTFRPTLTGNHLITAEYDAGIYTVTGEGWQKGPKKDFSDVKSSHYHYQYTKSIVAFAGSGEKAADKVIGQELEIVPFGFGHYHVGDSIALKVLYEGAALSTGTLTAAPSIDSGHSVDVAIPPDGRLSFNFDRPGHWMFKVRHTDPGKRKEGFFDEKVVTSVFTVMDVH